MNQINKRKYRATGGNRALLNDYHRRSDSLAQWQINFLPYSEQTYGFDYLGSGNHEIYTGSEYYPYLSGNYDLRFKSVECGKTDKVIVDFGSYPERDSVVFKDKWGVKLKVSKGNVLNFTGVAKPDTNYIYAYHGDQKIGKLFLNTYQQKTYKVVFVRVNGAAKKLNAKEITKYLNKVYNQCAVSFEDSIDDITIGNLTSFSHGGSGVLTVYNDDQKTILQAYDPQMKDGVYYLFFVDNVTDKKDGDGTLVSGYMPRGYNAGFIYDGGSEHTIAHELGHEIAGLEHVFENSSASGKTKNLMDYASGEELWHFQWDAIQDPSRVWMKWNKDEEEGESIFNEGAFYVSISSNPNLKIYNNTIINAFIGTIFKLDVIGNQKYLEYRVKNIYEKDGRFNFINIKNISIDPIDVIWTDSNGSIIDVSNINLSKGVYIITVSVSKIKVTSDVVKKENGQKRANILTLDTYINPITFSIKVYDFSSIYLIPADIDNYYNYFGYDDAQIEQCQKANDYSKIIINDSDYYSPWITMQPNVCAELKLDVNLAEDLFKNIKAEIKTDLYTQTTTIKTQFVNTMYFVVKGDENIKINGSDSVIIDLENIDTNLFISSQYEHSGYVEIYTYLLDNRYLSGRLDVDCRKIKTVGTIQFVSINDFKMDTSKLYNEVNMYLNQAGIKFELSKQLIEFSNVGFNQNSFLTNLQKLIVHPKKSYFYVFCHPYGFGGAEEGNAFFPSIENKSGWLELRTDKANVLVHELLHTMGLPHTHDSSKIDINSDTKLIFRNKRNIPKYSTNNLLDYATTISDIRHTLLKYQINHLYNVFCHDK